MARVAEPAQPLGPKAKGLYEHLVSTRGRIDGMYRTLLNHPDLLEHVSALGTYFRYGDSRLPSRLRELSILRVARRLGAAYEWVKHEPVARELGLEHDTIESLRQGRAPEGCPDLERQVLAAVDLVLERRSLPESLQSALADAVGLEAVIELVALCGFYQMIAGVIFAFDVPLPEGSAPPFE